MGPVRSMFTIDSMTSVVLFSGGLDSAVLVADEATRGTVYPAYIRAGLAWEARERDAAGAFIAMLPQRGAVAPLASLAVDMTDVYAATHWALQGRPPAYDTPDEDVYLPGRNVVLLAKAAVYAAATGAQRLVIGTLAHNPFPDATPEFRDAMARAVSLGLAHPLTIDAPYSDTGKADVIRRGVALGVRLELTLSCMNPPKLEGGDSRLGTERPEPPASNLQPPPALHCGACSKCRERHDAFNAAGVPDPTPYVAPPPR